MIHLGLALAFGWSSAGLTLDSIETIESAIAARTVTSIDEVWRHLPFEMHRAPVVSYDGFGPAPTTARRPRLITADNDGGLFAAAANDPKHRSFDRLDLASADPVTGEIKLFLVDFKNPSVVTRNPRECMGCHSVNGTIRLRVEPYPHWPGWFGHHDRLEQEPGLRFVTSEARAMGQFLKAQRHMPRLLMPFTDAFHMIEPVHDAAIRLTVLAVRTEARAAVHRFKNSPAYARLALALAATDGDDQTRFKFLLDDDSRADFEAAEPELGRELRENVSRYALITNEAFRRTNGGRWRVDPPGLDYRALVPFEWAFRKAGLSLAAYSTSVAPGVLNINTGVGSLSDYLRQFVADDLSAAHGLNNERFSRAHALAESQMLPGPVSYEAGFIDAVRAKMCQAELTNRKFRKAAGPRSARPAPSP